MDQPKQLRIHTQINSRYRVFDRSGQLPFSIVFGLCRRSPADLDARPLTLDTARSALDVPYALAHKLLTLYEDPSGDEQDIEIDVSRLTNVEGSSETLSSLSSPINRKEGKFKAFTTYHYDVDAHSELASILEPNKKYTIRLTSEDLSVKWYAFRERDDLVSSEGKPLQPTGDARLVNSKPSAGRATFEAVTSLPWPPLVTIHLRLRFNEPAADAPPSHHSSTSLEVLITNQGDRTISVQARGSQRLLVPWGAFQPKEETEDPRPQIIDTESTGSSMLQVLDARTGAMLRDATKAPPCGLYEPNGDHRPRLSSLVTLKPAEPLIKRIDISKTLSGLPNGRYSTCLQSKKAWWCFGSLEEIAEESDNRVPKLLYKTTIPPLVLESTDSVELQYQSGECFPLSEP